MPIPKSNRSTLLGRRKRSADVKRKLAKIRRADRVVFHFPIWWFGPPAILKGWFDRVLAHGALPWEKAIFCVTTGSRETESSYCSKEGDIDMLLWPLAYALRYLGFTVLRAQTAHGVHGYYESAARKALGARLRQRLAQHRVDIENFDTLPRIAFNTDADFDADGCLSPDAKSHSGFIRHNP